MPSIILWVVGLILVIWGLYRLHHEFKTNKRRNNFLQLILIGQASGIGQFASGIVAIVLGFVALYF